MTRSKRGSAQLGKSSCMVLIAVCMLISTWSPLCIKSSTRLSGGYSPASIRLHCTSVSDPWKYALLQGHFSLRNTFSCRKRIRMVLPPTNQICALTRLWEWLHRTTYASFPGHVNTPCWERTKCILRVISHFMLVLVNRLTNFR